MYAIVSPVSVGLPPATCTRLDIANVSINSLSSPAAPGSASLQWMLSDTGSASGSLALSGDAYAAWGTDDEYLYTYTAAQLGLTIIEIVPDAPPAPPEPVITAPPVLFDGAPAAPVTADPVPAPSNE